MAVLMACVLFALLFPFVASFDNWKGNDYHPLLASSMELPGVRVRLQPRGLHYLNQIERGRNGSAHVTSLACHTTIRTVEVQNHNGGLFGLAVTVFKQGVSDNVRTLLQGLICKKIRRFVDQDLNSKLAESQSRTRLSAAINNKAIRTKNLFWDHRGTQIPTSSGSGIDIASLFGEDLSREFFIDFRLKEDPSCGKDSVDLASAGEISYRGKGGTPFYPVAMSWPTAAATDDSMLGLLVSDFLPNSLFYHAYKQRMIKLLLTQNTPGVASFLKTSCDGSFCIADLVPQLADAHPNSTIEIAISATRAPALIFTEKNGGTISVSIAAVVIVFVVKPGVRKQVTVLDLDVVADAKLNLQKQNIRGTVSLPKFDLHHRFGEVRIEADELGDIALLVSELLQRMINEMLSAGVPLPLPHVLDLHDVNVTVLARRLYVHTDFEVDQRGISKLAAKTLFNGPNFHDPLVPISSVVSSPNPFSPNRAPVPPSRPRNPMVNSASIDSRTSSNDINKDTTRNAHGIVQISSLPLLTRPIMRHAPVVSDWPLIS